eukprot:5284035-Lingulodinium_polyedra.AAC.1
MHHDDAKETYERMMSRNAAWVAIGWCFGRRLGDAWVMLGCNCGAMLGCLGAAWVLHGRCSGAAR